MWELFNKHHSSSNTNTDLDNHDNSHHHSFYNQLPQYPYAEWLSLTYHLLWMGGGTNQDKITSTTTKNSKKKKLDLDPVDYFKLPQNKAKEIPISRMHFDRMENLMTMIRGRKVFVLYDPLQSENLYGDVPMITASYQAQVVRNQNQNQNNNKKNKNKDIEITYIRNSSKINMEPHIFHTYSPVNVRAPNYERFPKFKNAKGMICEIEEGDTIYVPSHWWHEVRYLYYDLIF